MTGRAFTHEDHPELIPQFFVSELHVDPFSSEFGAAAQRVTAASAEPLDEASMQSLKELQRAGTLPWASAARLVRTIARCFARHHPTPSWRDYAILLAESAEMAWIASEGNVFNHAADRVASLEDVVLAQRKMGRRVKPTIEVSSSGRVRQTALRADKVERQFLDESGKIITRRVPGSFFEFIERDALPDGRIDLRFDSSNAQGIFKMTAALVA